jgi:hypothetical protein
MKSLKHKIKLWVGGRVVFLDQMRGARWKYFKKRCSKINPIRRRSRQVTPAGASTKNMCSFTEFCTTTITAFISVLL